MQNDLQDRINTMPLTDESKQRLLDAMNAGGHCEIEYGIYYAGDDEYSEYTDEELSNFDEYDYPYFDPEQALFNLVDRYVKEDGKYGRTYSGPNLHWYISASDIDYDDEWYHFEDGDMCRRGSLYVVDNNFSDKDPILKTNRLSLTSYDDVMSWYDDYKQRMLQENISKETTIQDIDWGFSFNGGQKSYIVAKMQLDGQMQDVKFPTEFGGHEFDHREIAMLLTGRTLPMTFRSGRSGEVAIGKVNIAGEEKYGLVRVDLEKKKSRNLPSFSEQMQNDEKAIGMDL